MSYHEYYQPTEPQDIDDSDQEYCIYCGNPKVNNWTSCCGEVHFSKDIGESNE